MSPGALCLVSVLQSVEGLTDRAAAEAVRARIDWKYALGLALDDPGFDASVLSEFRARLIAHGIAARVLEVVLDRCRAAGLLEERGAVRTDSTHVLAAIKQSNLLEAVGEVLRSALEAVAARAPEWLAGQIGAEHVQRYGKPVDNWRLPKTDAQRSRWLAQAGADGFALLDAIGGAGVPGGLSDVVAVSTLATVWSQRFERREGKVVVREIKDLPPAESLIVSPYDRDARYSVKRGFAWEGYKVHLSETCGEATPNLVVAVHTTHGAVQDLSCTAVIGEQLAARGIAPEVHFVDQGYVAAHHIVGAAERGTDLHGPIRGDWHTPKGGKRLFKRSDFTIDLDAKVATCPAGQQSSTWSERPARNGTPQAHLFFRASICRPCPMRSECTTAKMGRDGHGRGLSVMLGEPARAMAKRRADQVTDEWKEQYKRRAGIEGTISQATRRIGMRHAKYRSEPKTRLQHIIGAAAINLLRLNAWLSGHQSETTRTTHLAQLKLETQP